MNAALFKSLLKTNVLGKHAVFYEKVDSTNLFLKRMALEGCTHGQLVVAEHQEAGRGRRGRSWSDESGLSLCMSLLLREGISMQNAPRYPIAAALGLHEALAGFGVFAKIKWPNDLLYEGKKLAGILLEAAFFEGKPFFVIGIGVNVNQASFESALGETATSIRLVANKEFAREAVLASLLNALEGVYNLCESDAGFQTLLERYAPLSCTLGQAVNITGVEQQFSGRAEALDGLGRLMVRTGENELVTVSAGDVSVRPL